MHHEKKIFLPISFKIYVLLCMKPEKGMNNEMIFESYHQ